MARDERSRSNGGNGKAKKWMKTIVVGPFRMAFPALLDPEDTDNGERYKMTCLFQPGHKDIPIIEDALYDAMEAGFGKDERDWPTGRHDVHPKDKFYDAGTKKYNGFKPGWMALPVSSQDAPGLVDADNNEVISKREVYGGRWARAQINITFYDNKSKGVTAYLNHVQLLENDEGFSGKGDASDAFDKYELKDRGNRRRGDDEETDRRGRGRDDDRRDDRDGSRDRNGRDRDRDDDRRRDDRGEDRRARDDDRRSGDREEGRSRDRGEDRDERRGSRGRDEEEARPSSRRGDSRDDDRRRDGDEDDRGRRGSRGRQEDEDPRESRGRSRDDDKRRDEPEDDRRPSRRSRDDERDERDSGRDSPRRGRDAESDWN